MERTAKDVKALLQEEHDEVLTTDEAVAKYEFISFLAPYAFVERRSDGVKGTLEFVHMPRFYFGFQPK